MPTPFARYLPKQQVFILIILHITSIVFILFYNIFIYKCINNKSKYGYNNNNIFFIFFFVNTDQPTKQIGLLYISLLLFIHNNITIN